ncbi:transcriptional regulation of mitochondrial recombination domain containing protein [Naviculisporaceae sp. PSN 640]
MKWLKAHPQNPITIPNTKLHVPKGHGENIWLWHHTDAGHVVYSLTPQMDSNKALAQFPYTGKKLVPPKLRRDYWAPFLQIQFPAGQGEIGRSVWQKLLELKKRHELEWGDEVRQEYYCMSREERGRAINDQRANVIADIAAVLGGLGKGNKIVLKDEKTGKEAGLCDAKVFWTNARDRFYAASWPENVTHWVGLPRKGVESVQLDVAEPEPAVEEKEAKEGEEGEAKEGEVKEVKEGEVEKKEGEATSGKL